jgi:UDP-glucose 4-epimerase
MALINLHLNETIGITGGSGFIGSHLTPVLDAAGISYRIFAGNLLDTKDIELFFLGTRITTIVHLAGTFEGSFQSLLEKNVMTTENLLGTGIKHGLKKLIYTSTGAVYGDPVNEQSTEADPLQPNTFYGLSKKFAEDCVRYYQQNHQLHYVILRYPNVYGEGNKKGVLYNFLQAIKNKGEIAIAGTGEQSRNFLHVTDACNAIVKALSYHGAPDSFNISNPIRFTINDVVRKFQKHYDFSVTYKPKDNYLKDLLLNIDKAEEKLKFKITVPDISGFIEKGG